MRYDVNDQAFSNVLLSSSVIHYKPQCMDCGVSCQCIENLPHSWGLGWQVRSLKSLLTSSSPHESSSVIVGNENQYHFPCLPHAVKSMCQSWIAYIFSRVPFLQVFNIHIWSRPLQHESIHSLLLAQEIIEWLLFRCRAIIWETSRYPEAEVHDNDQ